MIALRKLGPGALGLAEVEARPPGDGEVLLDVVAAGICGTDLHIADDEFPSHPPVTMGHEVTGLVAEVGSGVDQAWLGRRVACETYASVCRQCEHCRQGRENLCGQRRSIGSAVDGGFGPSLTIAAARLWAVPPHVGDHAGALFEPLACVAQCLLDPPVVGAGDRVLVTGPGPMGLLTALVAQASGGDVTLLGLERDKPRLDLAGELGLRAVVAGGSGGAAGGSGGGSGGAGGGSGGGSGGAGGGYDVVCEASGAVAAAATCLGAVRKGGRYVQVGIFGRPIELDLDQVLYKELTVTSGNASTARSWARAAALLAAGRVHLDPLVTDAVPLAEWERAFAAVRAGDGVKTVLVPG